MAFKKEDESEIKNTTENSDFPPSSDDSTVESEEQDAASLDQESQETESIDDFKQQLDDMSNRYIRLMAEFDNFKKRASRDYERLVETANEKMMIDIIEVRENFERALKSGEASVDFTSFFDGMKLIFSKFETILSKHGLESFAGEGEPFDPQIHDALMKSPNEDIPEDHIITVFEKGYKLKNKIIKHAKVIVSSGKNV